MTGNRVMDLGNGRRGEGVVKEPTAPYGYAFFF